MRRRHELAMGGVLVVLLCVSGCGSGSGGSHDASVAGTGGATGSGGAGGGTGGSSGGGAFMAVPPCSAQADYSTSGNTIMFGGASATYTPKCLKVSVGTSVTFAGDFSAHPLSPSAMRGTMPGNPITHAGSGATKAFTFSAPGFWAYYCDLHGPSDSGAGMVGVVWAE